MVHKGKCAHFEIQNPRGGGKGRDESGKSEAQLCRVNGLNCYPTYSGKRRLSFNSAFLLIA